MERGQISPPFFTRAFLDRRPHEENNNPCKSKKVLRMFYDRMKRVPQVSGCFGAVLVDMPLQHCMALKDCASRGAYGDGATSFEKRGLDWRVCSNSISRCRHGPEGVQFRKARDFSMHWAGLQATIRTSKSEATVLDWKRVTCPLQGGGEAVPHVEGLKYLGVLFTSAFAILEPASSSSFSLKVFFLTWFRV